MAVAKRLTSNGRTATIPPVVNTAVKERFEYIKKVGNVVYADLANSIKEENKHPFQQAPKQKKQSENRPKRRKINRNRNIAISIGVGAGVIALVLVIAKILK